MPVLVTDRWLVIEDTEHEADSPDFLEFFLSNSIKFRIFTIQVKHTHFTVAIYGSPLELETNICEDFTITEMAPTKAFSWLKVRV